MIQDFTCRWQCRPPDMAFGLLGRGFRGGAEGGRGETCFHSFHFYSPFCAVPNLGVFSVPFFSCLVSSFSALTLFLPIFPKSKRGRLAMKTNASFFSPRKIRSEMWELANEKEAGVLVSCYSMMFGCLDCICVEHILDITSR